MDRSLLIALATTGAAAALEGMCAGTKVKATLDSFRSPRYSAPLWVWSIVGGIYYIVFGFVLYRLLMLPASPLRGGALVLIVLMMIANAFASYVIFRAKNLRLNFVIGALFPILDVLLLSLAMALDTPAAVALIPYLAYRIYGVWWCWALWQANSGAAVA